jgi:RNA polymerase sigma factor (sigma-70 family)
VTDKNKSKDQIIQELYLTYRKELIGFIVGKYSLDHSQAEDIVQMVFIRFNEFEPINEIENPRAFLYKMCGNTAIDKLRHEKVKSKYFDASSIYEEPYTEIGPEEEIDSRERLNIITRAMWAMPSKRRELLAMKGIDGLSYAEIARRVGLSETVVRKHISKALADCHKALGSTGAK